MLGILDSSTGDEAYDVVTVDATIGDIITTAWFVARLRARAGVSAPEAYRYLRALEADYMVERVARGLWLVCG